MDKDMMSSGIFRRNRLGEGLVEKGPFDIMIHFKEEL
jgi:hypothetical protein